jgi:hypothetical protein
MEADKLLFVLDASINNTMNKLPTDIRNMTAKDFFFRCDTEPEFKIATDLKFEIFDEFNLLGNNPPKTQVDSLSV